LTVGRQLSTIAIVKHAIVTVVLMVVSAGSAAYLATARAADARAKEAQAFADERVRSAQGCLDAARAVRDKDQQRCQRAVATHDASLCDWLSAQLDEKDPPNWPRPIDPRY
jgi:hypothetical protein